MEEDRSESVIQSEPVGEWSKDRNSRDLFEHVDEQAAKISKLSKKRGDSPEYSQVLRNVADGDSHPKVTVEQSRQIQRDSQYLHLDMGKGSMAAKAMKAAMNE